MKVGILGTGIVGRSLAAGFAANGHDVMIGTRDVDALMARTEPDGMGAPPFAAWHADHGDVRVGPFAETGAHGELLVNATLGAVSIDVLRAAGAGDVDARIVIDASNPLDFSGGSASLFVGIDDSLAERIQREFPAARVVKAWNTMTAALMTDPSLVAGGDHSIPICGDDADARREVAALLGAFGWRDVVDLGDLTGARAMETYVLLWLRLYTSAGTPMVNIKVVH
jgi:8-hydroxy-5-deazaflavin:NADPH oxidoreductase